MKQRGMKILSLAVVLVLVSMTPTVSASASLKRQRLTGSKAPDFTLETTQGTKEGLSGVKGKEAMLFFFTTWCPYCREKMPFVAEEYQKKGSEVKIIPIDVGESRTKVVSYTEKIDLPFPVLLDTDTRVSQAYGVIGVPTIVLIGEDGNVVWTGNDIPDDYRERLKRS